MDEALEVIYNDLKTQKEVLLEAIMGSGKTVIAARLINRLYFEFKKMSFLILMHKPDLIDQFCNTFVDMTDIPPSKFGICCTSKNEKKVKKQITIGSIQTFIGSVKNYYKCDLLIIDEVHNVSIGSNSQYDQVIKSLRIKNPNMRILGLTATPYRMGHGYIYGDEKKYGNENLFSKLNHRITYAEMLEQKQLMPLHGEIYMNSELLNDLANVDIDINGDFVLRQLSQVMEKVIHIKTAVEAIKKYCNGYKRICVFACTIEHAMLLYDAIKKEYPEKVAIVHSNTKILSKLERASNMYAWKMGFRPIMISVNILSEGSDFPMLDCLVCTRTTKSARFFKQMVGRPLRMHPEKKKILFIDLTPNSLEFGLDLDNIEITIPKKQQDNDKKEIGTNQKRCPECSELVHVAIRLCSNCGYEWTKEENEKIIAKKLPELKSVLFGSKEIKKKQIPFQWYDVDKTEISIHTTKKINEETNKPNRLGKITLHYQENYFSYKKAYIWFCFSDYYEGYAVIESSKRWKQFSHRDFPFHVQEFRKLWGTIRYPTRILVDSNKEYPEIKDFEFNEDKIEDKIIEISEDHNFSYDIDELPF